MSPAPDQDGFYRPTTENELIELVHMARCKKLKLRVHGAGHSVAHAIYADPLDGIPNKIRPQVAAAGDNVDVLLEKYVGYRVVNERQKIIEVCAGMHLGDAPDHPGASRATSLLNALHDNHGWTLNATGGITHQTVSGFVGTGSSGGSLLYSLNDNICGFRVIDGLGRVCDVTPGEERFDAMVPNLGLLGIVSTVTLRCVADFNVDGEQVITGVTGEDRVVDLFGPGSGGLPSLRDFLLDREYARIEWWPQRGAERAVVRTCDRIPATPGFHPNRFKQFPGGEITQFFVGAIFTMLGKRDDLAEVGPDLRAALAQLPPEARRQITDWARQLEPAGERFAWFLDDAASPDSDYVVESVVGDWVTRELPEFFPRLLDVFIRKHPPEPFADFAWRGLPTDYAVRDKYIPVEFTEMWVPLPRTECVMSIMHEYFEVDDEHTAYKRTGTFAFELYAAKANAFWLNPAYSSGDDEWADGAFRIDVYWFARNAGDPTAAFFPQFWDLLREKDIPFRLHWGKFLPVLNRDPECVAHIRRQYPKWDAFLDLRTELDPDGIFLNRYWREHLGITSP
jgi:FAD/FMN-containing dehydrogenase